MSGWLASLAGYPYLAGSLESLVVALLALYTISEHRRDLLIAGLCAVPMALHSMTMVPDYWNPRRIAVLLVGPEDVLFCFSFGVIAWAFAVAPWRSRLATRPQPATAAAWAAMISLFGYLLYDVARMAGTPTMGSHLLAMVGVALALLSVRPRLWRLSLSGALILPLFYILGTAPIVLVWPDFFGQWSTGGTSGYSLAGIPIEELLWAIGFGACFPAMVGCMLDARVAPESGSAE